MHRGFKWTPCLSFRHRYVGARMRYFVSFMTFTFIRLTNTPIAHTISTDVTSKLKVKRSIIVLVVPARMAVFSDLDILLMNFEKTWKEGQI